MCLAIPLKIIEIIDSDRAIADCGGIFQQIITSLVDGVKINDFVIVHAGYALSKLDKVEAQKTLALIDEMRQADGVY